MTHGAKNIESFRQKLDETHSWPGEYLFKCIVPKDSVSKVETVFSNDLMTLRESKGGKYVSVSVTRVVLSSDEVLRVYEDLASIENIICL